MQRLLVLSLFCFSLVFLTSCGDRASEKKESETNVVRAPRFIENYRPQFHFTPEANWMNDPNGLVYHQGTYHLFYQYYPDDTVWGPMHWGHATSKDMIFWEHQPIALYPDGLGYIFSGSAVLDAANTSGFGTPDNPPLVAAFTYHDINGERAGENDFQTQGIAYSLDNGESWQKYEGNPVIGNDGIKDFRDPKVFWHQASQSWIMVLVAGDYAKIYRSPDLKEWSWTSDFGIDKGAHGGVWECPDLFPLRVDGGGEEKWVLLISINPGAPNGGSGTQYFIGDFDGEKFSSSQTEARWLDWGRDNYAGITYNNTPNGERIFIGWMSNWDYARDTPTEKWRSAMTLPRDLSLEMVADNYMLFNYPIDNIGTIFKSEYKENIVVKADSSHRLVFDHFNESEIRFETALRDFELNFTNESGDTLKLALDSEAKEFVLDRSRSGKVDFHEKFVNGVQRIPMDEPLGEVFEIRILMDWSSIEVFINEGQYALTAQIFPNEHYQNLEIKNQGENDLILLNFEVDAAESIWN